MGVVHEGQQPSSRSSAAGAGWAACAGPGAWKQDVPPGAKPLSWIRPGTLWRARNDVIARRLHDPVGSARRAWIELARERARKTGANEDFVVKRREGEDVSFLLLGDPGEGYDPQYAVVPGLLAQDEGIDFAFICSDLIYPTGDLADYGAKHYHPYRALQMPIFGIPGNHDWYDGLHGFMHAICGIDAPDAALDLGRGVRRWLAQWLWRRSAPPSAEALAQMETERSSPAQRAGMPQPAPYLVIDAGPLRLVGIDTGICGELDADQGAWLRRVSFEDSRPKVLLTGKPLYVDGVRHPGRIDGEETTVDDIVRDPRANYVAAIGGDIHNYQRYPVTLDDGRVLQYIVSGGGGAFMHATHQISRVELPGVDEHDFRCYPLRGDSLTRYSQLYDRRFARGKGRLALSPEEGAAYMADLLKLPTTRAGVPPLSPRARRIGKLIQPLPATRGFQRFLSEAFNWSDPPLFKSFLRLDATAAQLRIRCFGVSGCAETEHAPALEDEVVIAL